MSDNFPTAAEARAALNSRVNLAAQAELRALKTAISKAIEQGKNSISVMSMATSVTSYLREQGYTVRYMEADRRNNDQRESDYYMVSW